MLLRRNIEFHGGAVSINMSRLRSAGERRNLRSRTFLRSLQDRFFCGDVIRGYHPQAGSTPGYFLSSLQDAFRRVTAYGGVESRVGQSRLTILFFDVSRDWPTYLRDDKNR
jgi:hypothetical protein